MIMADLGYSYSLMASKYQNALDEGRDLTAEARTGTTPPFREAIVAELARSISGGRSVLLVGPSGVGKTSVLHAYARHLLQTGPRKLVEFSTPQLMAGTVFLGEWQTKVSAIVERAAEKRTIIYISDIWNLPSAGRSSNREDTIWDAVRPALMSGKIQIVGELDAAQLVALNAMPGFSAPFECIEVPSLSPVEIAAIVRNEALRSGLEADASAVPRLMELCDSFLPHSPGPGLALRLIEHILDYRNQKRGVGEDEVVNAAFVEKVFSVYTGLPRFIVSRSEVRSPAEIRDWFRARIVGQRDAIDAVVQTIALFKAGLHDSRKPIGSLLFVGPTGVGKTELARALALFLFGSERRLLRFDLSEYKDYHSFEMLIGDPKHPDRPARLVDPVRAQPFQVVLLDEIEKGHGNIWDLLLQVLDDGRLTPPSGRSVNFRNTIIVATANVGAQAMERKPMGFTDAAAGVDVTRLQQELEAVFRPELLNRFQHIVRFSRLTRDEVKEIARSELTRLLEREGIVTRRLTVDVDNEVLDRVVEQGYDAKYGARALKRHLQQRVIMPIATLLMERPVDDGSILHVWVRRGEIDVTVVESDISRETRREREPMRLAGGQKMSREELEERLQLAKAVVAELQHDERIVALLQQREALEPRRSSNDLWSDPRAAATVIESCERIDRIRIRIENLAREQDEIHEVWKRTVRREERTRLADRIVGHERNVDRAYRELVRLGLDGYWDALLEIRPLGAARNARDLLYEVYAGWARERRYRVRMAFEPLTDEEPVMLVIAGPYAFGYLRLEAGHHRVRAGEQTSVARVALAALDKPAQEVALEEQRALKLQGQYGGRVRSRIDARGRDFAVQNDLSLSENRDLVAELAPCWAAAGAASARVVRRYDLEPFLIKDYLADVSSGRLNILKPDNFDALLRDRIDIAARRPPD
jgi:ATP-dependent Clp protease ATP-binding subunit ClpC